MSQVLIHTDRLADQGTSIPTIVAEYVDPDTVIYAAHQRALRYRRLAPTMGVSKVDMQASLWMDAFIAGAKFQQLKNNGTLE